MTRSRGVILREAFFSRPKNPYLASILSVFSWKKGLHISQDILSITKVKYQSTTSPLFPYLLAYLFTPLLRFTILMPHNGLERTGGDTGHAPPAAAHIQERRFPLLETAEGITAADFARQASTTSPAAVVIHFQHDMSCAFHTRLNLFSIQI